MAGTGLVAGEVVVDALPYFDQGYEAPGVREAVSAGCVLRGHPRHAALSRRDPGLFSFLGCGPGGGGNAQIPADQELPELPDSAGLLCL